MQLLSPCQRSGLRSGQMQIADLYPDSVVLARPHNTVHDAARLMRRHNVGSLVVVDGPAGARMPAGILTERDIVDVVARGRDPALLTVAEIMSEHVVLAQESDDVLETIEKMRQ